MVRVLTLFEHAKVELSEVVDSCVLLIILASAVPVTTILICLDINDLLQSHLYIGNAALTFRVVNVDFKLNSLVTVINWL